MNVKAKKKERPARVLFVLHKMMGVELCGSLNTLYGTFKGNSNHVTMTAVRSKSIHDVRCLFILFCFVIIDITKPTAGKTHHNTIIPFQPKLPII